MSIAHELAQRITALTYADLPPAAVHWAKVGILDTVGVTLAGSREDTATLAGRALGSGAGPSYVFGNDSRVNPLDAALINGAASHALDFDDCNNTFGGHPSAPILPALFALADEIGANGREFITAYVAGFEAETKIALAVNFHHYTKGWHPTATLGVFGSAAACAHLLKLVRDIPADKLMLETDSPYLTPRDLHPQPKARRNEPSHLPHILRTVARALGKPAEQVAEETTRNARTFFGLP